MAELLESDIPNDELLASSPPPSPELSSWINEIEQMLLNADDYVTEPPPEKNEAGAGSCADENTHQQQEQEQQSFEGDFFAGLDLPNSNTANSDEDDFSHLFVDFSVGPEFDEIMGFNFEDLVDLNYESSTPESQFKPFVDENSGTESQGRVRKRDSTPESHVNEGHSASDSQVRVLGSENSKPSDANDDDDPIAKKRKRQMRNRDAAVKSRERKKIYVKDLEVKSRYLEGECIRLQRLLQWVAAENQALHLQLHSNAISASRTKQESAVLLLETLLLVSLLWFLGTMGLFPHLEMRPHLKRNKLENVDSINQKVVDLGRAKSKSMGLGTLRLFFKSKRCKASRSKMKVMTYFGAVVA